MEYVSSAQKNCFKWPGKDDDDDIICGINAPIPVNQRNNFVLFAADFENVNEMTKLKKFLKKK